VAIVTILTLCATLSAGLWPFHSPRNQVSWIDGENGLRFGRHGTALSEGKLRPRSNDKTGCTIEVWLRPALTWATGSVLAFYDSENHRLLSVIQDYTDLVLQLEPGQGSRRENATELRVADVFRKAEAVLTITSDAKGTAVYIDGRLATSSPAFRLSVNDVSGRLILGNSPMREHGWRGELLGLAIYQGKLSAEQVRQNDQDWIGSDGAAIGRSGDAIAVYRFDEHAGRVVHNSIPAGANLEIPRRFVLVDQLRFESPVTEFDTQRTYISNVIYNVVGFMPLGFMVSLCLVLYRSGKGTALIAVLTGTAVSFTIEYFQSYIPIRFSGWTDIFTNTTGTAIGVAMCAMLVRSLTKDSASA